MDEEIKVGDYVRLRRLNYHGEVISLSKNKAVVLANGMKMNVKCDELEKMQPPEKKATEEKPAADECGGSPFESIDDAALDGLLYVWHVRS